MDIKDNALLKDSTITKERAEQYCSLDYNFFKYQALDFVFTTEEIKVLRACITIPNIQEHCYAPVLDTTNHVDPTADKPKNWNKIEKACPKDVQTGIKNKVIINSTGLLQVLTTLNTNNGNTLTLGVLSAFILLEFLQENFDTLGVDGSVLLKIIFRIQTKLGFSYITYIKKNITKKPMFTTIEMLQIQIPTGV